MFASKVPRRACFDCPWKALLPTKTTCCQRVATARRYGSKVERQRDRRDNPWDSHLGHLMNDTQSYGIDSTSSDEGSPLTWWDNLLADMGPESEADALMGFGRESKGDRMKAQPRTPRRVTMTVKERQVLDTMFDDLFNVSRGAPSDSDEPEQAPTMTKSPSPGLHASAFVKILNRARRSKHEDTQLKLDAMSEAIDRAMTDLELLQWAEESVFAASVEYATAANEAIRTAVDRSTSLRESADALPPLQPPAYAEVLAKLMRVFREKWRDPHLALAIFEHARNLSVYSYTLGCTTPVYNELLETRWTCFRDLIGVKLAAEEMRANGIPPDSRTQEIWERVRREAGRSVDSEAVREVIARIDALINRRHPVKHRSSGSRISHMSMQRPRVGAAGRNIWRDPKMQEADGLDFGDWGDGISGEEQLLEVSRTSTMSAV